MAWLRIDDKMILSMKILGLIDDGVTGERAKDQRAAAVGVWTMLLTWCSADGSNGFLPHFVVDMYGTKRTLARLLRARFDRQPLLHTLGEDGQAPECRCLEGRAWPPDMQFALHDFLDRNPSRSEVDVQRAKKAELRNAKLKQAVRDRDRDMCRYCGKHCAHSDRTSDDGLTFDHVDPEVADGINNLVVACRGCNNRKNKRTPEQADMALLPVPGSLPEPRQTYDETCDGPTSGAATVAGPVTALVVAPDPRPRPDQGADLSADLRQDASLSQVSTSPGRDGAGTGTAIGPPDTLRTSVHPSPYAPKFGPYHAGRPPDRDSPPTTATAPAGGEPRAP
ncbi:HNH endonuclease [Actinophytocola sp.]|uniref:HNH endonuclease n=1 Tax=Actinophytocola sp. TaxID=1872138 RepID=UPI002D27FEE2|nr:HNH endonuclease [Actinophytocola sp.]HYQ67771.1 HNH endonuclease [Actinophytocola sp.]